MSLSTGSFYILLSSFKNQVFSFNKAKNKIKYVFTIFFYFYYRFFAIVLLKIRSQMFEINHDF